MNLSPEDKTRLIEAINKDTEPAVDLLPKLFPGIAEKFDIQSLDRAKIPTLEYAGKRSKAAILSEAGAGIGVAPLQTVRCFGDAKQDEWRNLIVQGDNLQFLKTCFNNTDPLIKNKIKGKVKLIYIDPPFATKGDFRGSDEEKSYSDKIDSAEFIENLRERLIYMREILAEDGSIYVHCDWRMDSYIRLILDDLFGRNNFLNVITWHYYNIAPSSKKFFAKNHDVILWYAKKNKKQTFNLDELRIPYEEGSAYAKKGWSKGAKYTPNPKGKLMDDVWRIPTINNMAKERVGYPTQKPESLIKQILVASSNRDDLVIDCFAGSGTVAAVAEKLGRKWVVTDFGKHSIYTMQRRILRIGESKALVEEKDETGNIVVKKGNAYNKNSKPFSVVSSGAYDFSHIMDLRKHKNVYIDFVLGLFQLTRNEEKAKKFRLANIYTVNDNNPVEVYPVWDDEFLKEVKIDEDYLQGIINQSGGKLKGEYTIITPESCTNISDAILKNQDGKEVLFLIKTFPYKILEDISRNFELQEQPSSQDNVNNLITSTAFYFNEDVEFAAKRKENGLIVTNFKSKILDKEGNRFRGFSGLAMLLIDLDYEPGKPFDMDKTLFAKEIKEDGSVKINNLTQSVGLIAIDKHGNESKPFNLE